MIGFTVHSHLENYFVLFFTKNLVRPIQFYKLINNLKNSMLNRGIAFREGEFGLKLSTKTRGLWRTSNDLWPGFQIQTPQLIHWKAVDVVWMTLPRRLPVLIFRFNWRSSVGWLHCFVGQTDVNLASGWILDLVHVRRNHSAHGSSASSWIRLQAPNLQKK